jgi:hypothetical protein
MTSQARLGDSLSGSFILPVQSLFPGGFRGMATAPDSRVNGDIAPPRLTGFQPDEGNLRRRKGHSRESSDVDAGNGTNEDEKLEKGEDEVTWGRTPSGIGEFSFVSFTEPPLCSRTSCVMR